MTGSRFQARSWLAPLLVVTTGSMVVGYCPPVRADTGCSITLSRAQALETGIRLTAVSPGVRSTLWTGLGLLVAGGALALVFPPAIYAAYAGVGLLVGGGTGVAFAQVAAAIRGDQPGTPCEQAFNDLSGPDRLKVIALLKQGDPGTAMALVDASLQKETAALPPLPPNWIHLGLDPANYSGFGGSRGGATLASSAGSGQPVPGVGQAR